MLFNIFILWTFFQFKMISAGPLILSVPDVPGAELVKKRLAEVYKSIGIQIKYIELPGKRALLQSNQGKVDGEAGRIPGLEKEFSNLIPIPTKIAYLSLTVYGVNQEKYIKGKTFVGKKIAYIHGLKAAEKILEQHQSYALLSIESLFNFLLKGRADYGIVPTFMARAQFIKEPKKFAKIKALKPRALSIPLIHYLHIKNKNIFKKVDNALKKFEPLEI